MTFDEFQKKNRFSSEEVLAHSQGALISQAPAELPPLPGSLLLPFHEITKISWDQSTKTGRIEAVRHNRVDEWFYACHFLGDPVMPGCWGVDAVWQALRFFAAWRGLSSCGKVLAMEDVSFFGQIRPYDKKVVYSVEVLSIEEEGGEFLVTGKAVVSVDGTPVYTIGSVQVGSAYWETDHEARPLPGIPDAPDKPLIRKLSYDEFAAKGSLSRSEVLALSQGSLIASKGAEIGLLPSSLMLELGSVRSISYDEAGDEGRIVSSRPNSPLEWHFAMNHGEKPAALTIDAVWQQLGLFLTWRRNLGTGRALGFEKVEVFDAIGPADREILYEVRILRTSKTEGTGDAFVRADASVFADGRLVMRGVNFNVGCHRNIRYSDYPQANEMGYGGKLKTRETGSAA
ncbi:MAG: bifunctional 3-hydroxydecanoyl-ACP dehydratase/trans-2-decenoyl-ACP isomerase [Elusimicrobia bacterium]|nr:bifunctional 3-hydroxydecanoyl-ACP dehydratase/trans-2-decenoyl-ACP isomerase [Elusimicrobiota bacterium]